MRERVSSNGHSEAADKKRYLRCLCGGSKTAKQITDEMAADPAVSKAHRPRPR